MASYKALESAYQDASSGTAVYRNFSAAMTGLIREISIDHPNARFLIICHDMMSDGFEAADNAIANYVYSQVGSWLER